MPHPQGHALCRCAHENIGVAEKKIISDIIVEAAPFKVKCLKQYKLDLNKYRAILWHTHNQPALETQLSHPIRTILQGQMWSLRGSL